MKTSLTGIKEAARAAEAEESVRLILETLVANGGNVTKTSAELGLEQYALYRVAAKYGLELKMARALIMTGVTSASKLSKALGF